REGEARGVVDADVDELPAAAAAALVAGVEAGPAQYAADGRRRDADGFGDVLCSPAPPAQLDDLLTGRLGRRRAQPMRPRGPVLEAGRSLSLKALDPIS